MPRKLIYLMGAVCFSMLLLRPAYADEAVIRLVGYSPQQVHDLGLKTQRATPLQVIGIGQPVYLRSEHEGTYSWSLEVPGGSASALSSISTREVHFIPDMVGQYVVSLSFTDTQGASSTAQITITGATYIGNGGVDYIAPVYPQCALCHSDEVQEWGTTRHSTMLQRGLDGQISSHYRQSCLECHTTGYDTLAINGGFDDAARNAGWKFPDSLYPGVYNSFVANYPQVAMLGNIQCESCHGPGSEHHSSGPIGISYDAGVCAYCHEEAPSHYIPTAWRNSGHGKSLETDEAFNRAGNTCVPCHTAEGFFEVNINSNHTSTAPYKSFHGQTCAVCHDPHDSTGEHQLRIAEDYNSIDSVTHLARYKTTGEPAYACDVCHHLRPGTDIPGSRVHESHQTDMLNGTVGYRYPGVVYPNSKRHNTTDQDRCVGCHMAQASADKQNFVGGHTFSMFAAANPDSGGPATDLYLTEACQKCHSEIVANFDYKGTQTRVTELLDAVKARLVLSASGTPLYSKADMTAGKITEAQMNAAYNWYVVNNDGSRGIHNPKLAVALLESTLQSFGLTPECARCDFNSDGQLSIADAIYFLLLARDNPGNTCLDRNLDGRYTIGDAIALLVNIRKGTCPDKPTMLASANNLIAAEKVEGLTADQIKYLEDVLAQMNLTPEDKEAFHIALYGDEMSKASLPKAFSLSQNTPNPFNPSTTITYSVPEGKSVNVSLEVFDLRGQKVNTLVDEARESGTYAVFWNGIDSQGRKVASGIYFYRLRAGSFVQTRKMVLLK